LIDGQLGAQIVHHPSAARSIEHHIPAAVAAAVNCINHHELTKYTTTSCVGHQNWYPNNTHMLHVHVQIVDKSVGLSNTHEGMITDNTSSSSSSSSGPMNQHPPPHHPLDACYYSVVDEAQLS
jgi:hypothetical protein